MVPFQGKILVCLHTRRKQIRRYWPIYCACTAVRHVWVGVIPALRGFLQVPCLSIITNICKFQFDQETVGSSAIALISIEIPISCCHFVTSFHFKIILSFPFCLICRCYLYNAFQVMQFFQILYCQRVWPLFCNVKVKMNLSG